MLFDLGDGAADGGFVADIEHQAQVRVVWPELSGQLQHGIAAVRQHQPGAAARQQLAGGQPDAGGSPRDQGHASGKIMRPRHRIGRQGCAHFLTFFRKASAFSWVMVVQGTV